MSDRERTNAQAAARMRAYRERRKEQEALDRATAAYLAGRLAEQHPEAARVLASDVPSWLAGHIIEALQRRYANEGGDGCPRRCGNGGLNVEPHTITDG